MPITDFTIIGWEDTVLPDPIAPEWRIVRLQRSVELTQQISTVITKFSPPTLWLAYGDDHLLTATIWRIMMLDALTKQSVAFHSSSTTLTFPQFPLAANELNSIVAGDHTARKKAIIRDELGNVILSPVRITPPAGNKSFPGEAYVDEKRIAEGNILSVLVEPYEEGIRARAKNRFRWGKWVYGRAFQIGGVKPQVHNYLQVTGKSRDRVTFYPHNKSLLVYGLDNGT